MQEVSRTLELWAFYSNPSLLEKIISPHLTGLVVDLEKKDKFLRQKLYDTQITEHSIADLRYVKQATDLPVICRINRQQLLNKAEIEEVLEAGADEILLPMVKHVDEVGRVIDFVGGQAKTDIMIETTDAIRQARELDSLPIHRCYVGLNDLAIELGKSNIFTPLIDGTIDQLRNNLSKAFGVAGLTHADYGKPIPCRILIQKMAQLNCSFGILRRSFYRDLEKSDPETIYSSILNAYKSTPKAGLMEEEIQLIQEAFS